MYEKTKKVYIAHPFSDNPEENMEKVKKYIELAFTMGYFPLCTLTMFGYLHGKIDEKKVMEFCLDLIEIADEVWMCGKWHHSVGCNQEHEKAQLLKKPIRYFI